MLTPDPLHTGDLIRILSPASSIDPRFVHGAKSMLEREGYRVQISPHALDSHGSFSSEAHIRRNEFNDALRDPEVRAILCSRGGYGAVHLLEDLDREALHRDPKWIAGFSDISAIHAWAYTTGVKSLHSSMCRHLADFGNDDPVSRLMLGCLQGELPTYRFDTDNRSRCGSASGTLLGGNLAVLQALVSTPYDIIGRPGSILFIEDIAEPIYKVERILYQLYLSGALARLNGLIIGRFTEYRPSKDHDSIESMISRFIAHRIPSIPVAFNFPIGHIDCNYPMIEGSEVSLAITPAETILDFAG